jgi:N6-adenosine-specific RNA methylase IME4
MSRPAVIASTRTLPALVRQAADALAHAETAAQVLDAKESARLVYDASKRAARLAQAKGAHDSLVSAAHRAQADALEIEAAAKRRLADEYDSAQKRGEIARQGKPSRREGLQAKAAEIGLTHKEVHDARQVRDAITANPSVVREVLDDILARGDEPTRAALKRAIQPAVKSIRADVQAEKKERRHAREIELGARLTELPQKKYGIIVADPEWRFEPYSTDTGMDRAAENHYPTSDLHTIMRRDVGAIAAKDCLLFLWATAPMLIEAICVLDAWGFAWINRDPKTGFLSPDKTHARYVTNFCWIKQKMAGGYWNRGKHELLLVATRGNPVAPAQGDQLKSDFDGVAHAAGATGHSTKPEGFMAWIDANWPSTPKIELNARRVRPGWDAWGLEAPAVEAEESASQSQGGGSPAPAALGASPAGRDSDKAPASIPARRGRPRKAVPT